MERYIRHKNLFDKEQFEKLQNSTVIVSGAGGLGCSVLQLLVRIGVGKVYVYDYAKVDVPDLNRQILYSEDDIGKYKVISATEKLNKINSEVEIIAKLEKIEDSTELPSTDLVFDCLDNFQTRYILDKKLYPVGIPLIHGGVFNYFAQVTSIIPGYSKSFSDLFPLNAKQIDSESLKDIFPSVVMTTASIQVSEAIKYLTGKLDQMLINKVMMIDLLNNAFDIVEFK